MSCRVPNSLSFCCTTASEPSGNSTVQLKLNPKRKDAIAYLCTLRRFAI